jgi:hypothetical protein
MYKLKFKESTNFSGNIKDAKQMLNDKTYPTGQQLFEFKA